MNLNMDGFRLHHLVSGPIANLLQSKWIKEVKWMNPRATTNEAYQPTSVEHIANVVTHGMWVIPSLLAGVMLVQRSSTQMQLISALVYGTALLLVFTISTFFHSVHYCNHNRQLKDALHRCDRAMIYVFIAATYFPWLTVKDFPDDGLLIAMRYLVWIMAMLGILYQQVFHERFKMLETIFYLIMGIGPSIAIINITEISGIKELKVGGLIYVAGVVFFKSDGRIPCAHAIWHLFVATAAAFHYYAILNYLYPSPENLNLNVSTDSPHSGVLESHLEL
ncbi:monocyte to macrophage differentiation factor [Neodiprion pinetum]|uniref:Monocyte to macrophage differentiation factor n=1 Tax=Neodiprion lecontei TaxID=441921 RepID=A0A6J0BGD9_NEOLC|nr:monocyte to macrophage differentiation factor [Neodiprion lecontei]XP_046483756.1 monocyte to macrophage differentiation factor [Neodiprion pinetum]XP_046483757.1 monocyte to macrophage differentiation factor [Neodiprion pinetum]XP_046483758.1 monocyte to macrophage differentiation factor [Neodiprion pinetum]XP_046596935.1 monocyte to macrophage differentiation factor [Neodiprion lecontei]XP_046596936.1 monocyte to macrophage differentiation factor [Neodiprion lecontei]